ncbi:MAG TPA: tyrosine--tRNA ligase [Ktedonobacterales bacterium]|jgi:tyrosyl-tRNA synthetase|nr:tyrosine--tRNA ligase [Ktedonobacterales bacterium]
MAEEAKPTTNVIATLRERGLISQITESGLEELANRERLTVYCGFDPSRPSLQIGNVVPIILLAHFQRAGHRPILLVGGGTGMIGDPSFKSDERQMLTMEQVERNAERVRAQLSGYLSFEGENAAIMVNNIDWLGKMTLIEYLRDVGKHFTINNMMAKESVKSRIESREHGISYAEFSYMILQATDFLHLYDAMDCTVQVGGNDQWGNLTAGVDLIRKTREAHAHALTAPLVTSPSGAKLGKTESGALYLDPAMTTPYEMYQYWINTDDRDVGLYLRVFTFMPLDEIAEVEREQEENPASRVAQRRLAWEITRLVHGEAVADGVAAASSVLFGAGVASLTEATLPYLAQAVPTTPIAASALDAGLSPLDALVLSGAQPSKGAARRLMQQGGIYVNDERWNDPERPITREQALFGRALLLRAGKNRYHLLLVEE